MTKGMCITYEVDFGLYINVTNRCTNRCSFCIRNNGDGAYGSDSLWLAHEPDEKEILDSVFGRDLSKYKEIVFCGYGEPTERLEVIRGVAMKIKERCDIPIRVNTNGHSDLIFGKDTASLYSGAFDSVSISLNASTKEKYYEMCHPVYGISTFDAVIEFAKNVNKYVPCVAFSVVRQTLSEKELDECRSIAEAAGVPLRIRDYISG